MKDLNAQTLLESMTRDQLRTVAKALNIPVGKNKKDTFDGIHKAIARGDAQVKFVGSIIGRANPVPRPLFMKTFVEGILNNPFDMPPASVLKSEPCEAEKIIS
jgi:hypothetical protein